MHRNFPVTGTGRYKNGRVIPICVFVKWSHFWFYTKFPDPETAACVQVVCVSVYD